MRTKLAAIFLVLGMAVPALAEDVSTRYLTADLSDGWKVVMPPTENQASSTVIFSNAAGSSTVSFVAGPSGGLDTKAIAEMFARQFKAAKPPTEKNNQYLFTFTQQEATHQAWVTTMGEAFMVTTLSGDRKEGLAFVRKHVKSADFADLLPK